MTTTKTNEQAFENRIWDIRPGDRSQSRRNIQKYNLKKQDRGQVTVPQEYSKI